MSAAVQAARKSMQLKRLDEKENDPENYTTYYANQPAQLERAKLNKQYNDARKVLRDADEALEIAVITGDSLETAREAQAIAAQVVVMSKPPKAGSSAGLSVQGKGV